MNKKEKEEMQFKVDWCPVCGGTYITCPKCGNNCCNAAYGVMDENGKPLKWNEEGLPCDVCPLAYQYQYLYWKMEKFCTCSKECTCPVLRDDDFGLPYFDPDNPAQDCPIHTDNVKPDPNCPVHKEKE